MKDMERVRSFTRSITRLAKMQFEAFACMAFARRYDLEYFVRLKMSERRRNNAQSPTHNIFSSIGVCLFV